MTELLISGASAPSEVDGTILSVTPESAGWEHVGFEVLVLSSWRDRRASLRLRASCASS